VDRPDQFEPIHAFQLGEHHRRVTSTKVRRKFNLERTVMKLRTLAAYSLVWVAALTFPIAGIGQNLGIYASHPPRSAPRTVRTTNAAPHEVPASTAFWTKATNAPPVSVGAMLLLTDGRVLVHSEPNCNGCTGNYSSWYTLTPDDTGSYVNGTWTQVASLPGNYAPLFFGSAVLPDGKVVVQGGEYNCPNGNCGGGVWQSLGAIYNPAANTWTSTTAPSGSNIGDAESVVLPNGTWMLAECCAIHFGHSSFPVYYYFNESTLSFTNMASSSDGKNDEFDEEGWNLLPNNLVLTVDAYTTNTVLTGTNSETYNSSSNTWSTAGSTINQLWDSNCGLGGGSFEVGPGVLRPDGTVIATGASDCSPGHTSVYDSSTGTWTAGPDFPNNDAANDAPAALEVNGNVIIEASPFSGTFSAPSSVYEWDGTNLNAFPAPPNAVNTPSFQGHFLVLPNGQIMYTDYSTDVEFLTSAGTFNAAWQPTITIVPSTIAPGATYSISGTQFNGLSQARAYGDDFQDATNYPLVQILNNGTGHVFYCKTHGHSTMGVATGGTIVSTSFDVPTGVEGGASQLFVIANGIPSAPANVTVGSGFSLSATPGSQNVVPGGSTSYTVTATPLNGFSGTVNLTVSGCPTGATCTMNPTSVNLPPAQNSTLNVSTSSSTPDGTYTLTITGTSGSITQTTTVTLVVQSFTLGATPASQTVKKGASTTYTAKVTPMNGFNGTVTFSVSGLPANATATFSPSTVVGSGSSIMTVSTSKKTPVGTYTLTVNGASGSFAASANVSLKVSNNGK